MRGLMDMMKGKDDKVGSSTLDKDEDHTIMQLDILSCQTDEGGFGDKPG